MIIWCFWVKTTITVFSSARQNPCSYKPVNLHKMFSKARRWPHSVSNDWQWSNNVLKSQVLVILILKNHEMLLTSKAMERPHNYAFKIQATITWLFSKAMEWPHNYVFKIQPTMTWFFSKARQRLHNYVFKSQARQTHNSFQMPGNSPIIMFSKANGHI